MSGSKHRSSVVLRFTIVQGLIYASMAAFMAFYFALGLSKGFSQSELSLAVAFSMVAGIAGNLTWGSIADRIDNNKRIFLVTACAYVVTQTAAYLADTLPMFVAAMAVSYFSSAPLGPVLDTWTLRGIGYDIKRYGPIRGAGSIGYGILIFAAGFLINAYGYRTALIAANVLAFAAAACALTIRNITKKDVEAVGAASGTTAQARGQVTPAARTKGKAKGSILNSPLFGSSEYVGWVITVFLVGLAITPINNMKIVVVGSVGGDVSSLGVDGLIGCALQFVLMLCSGKITNLPLRVRKLIITLSVGMATFLCVIATNVLYIYAFTLIVYGIFSFVNPSSREIVRNNIPYEYQTVAISVCDLAYNNIASIVAMLYSGMISEHFGVHVMLTICFATSLVPLAMTLLEKKAKAKNACCQEPGV